MAAIEHLLGKYSKDNGESDLRNSIRNQESSDGIDVLKSDNSKIPIGYKKETGTISSFLIVVVSGGEVRERHYLNELAKKQTFPRIKLIFESSEKNKGGLSPKMMQSKLENLIEMGEPTKTHKILYSSIDKIFMVSDVDHYYSELVEIVQENSDSKIVWIISNPCFEIWLYYAHFPNIDDRIRVLEKLSQSKQSSTLKTINDTIVKGGIDPRKAFDLIQIANENSKNNYTVDKYGIPQLYSTNMYVLGEYILTAIGEQEFEKWLDGKQKRIETYRKMSI